MLTQINCIKLAIGIHFTNAMFCINTMYFFHHILLEVTAVDEQKKQVLHKVSQFFYSLPFLL